MKSLFIFSALSLSMLHACKKTESFRETVTMQFEDALLTSGIDLDSLLLPESDDFGAIPQDVKNPLTTEKIQLGKLLFHETRLGAFPKSPEGLYTYSCASCHHAEAGFQSGLAQAIGDGGTGFGIAGELRIPSAIYISDSLDALPVKGPSILNIAYQDIMLWNGSMGATGMNENTQASWNGSFLKHNFLGYKGVETLAIAGLEKHRLYIDTTWFLADSTYKKLFFESFSEWPRKKRISNETAGLAIAAYERTVLANRSPLQKYLKGDKTALTDEQIEGAKLFFGKAKCGNCHNGPALNSMTFHALGMNDMQNGINGVINIPDEAPEFKGRGGFTGVKKDMFAFKVPQLYNLRDIRFFGHGASFTSVEDVIKYKNIAVSQNPNVPQSQLSKKFKPVNLTDDEIQKIARFIEDALYDPNLSRYVPDHLPSGNCIPNNDLQSRIDRGCQ